MSIYIYVCVCGIVEPLRCHESEVGGEVLYEHFLNVFYSLLCTNSENKVHQVSVSLARFFCPATRQITCDVHDLREVVRHMDMAHHKTYL